MLGEPSTKLQMEMVSKRLGIQLPPSYAAFLGLHNGWMDFVGTAMLLPAEEYDQPWVASRISRIRSPFKEFFDDHGPVARGSNCGFRLLAGQGDRDALASSQSIGLDDDRDGKSVERRHCLGDRLGANIVGGRDCGSPAKILGEALGSFQLRRRGIGPEYAESGRPQRIGYPAHEGGLRSDDDEVGIDRAGQLNHCMWLARVDGDAIGPAGDARVTRRRDQASARRRLPKPPGERILPTA